MTDGATEPRSRRRLFITMAVSRYKHLPEDAQLDNPSADAERISDLLSASAINRLYRAWATTGPRSRSVRP